ncbi:MAG: phenylalanine--tRNA ligase subunit beta [Patescibacteria group bacterium]|nr:phenylalanine--tRNA ligase subunit beta [Patescibacteria group bacterium]
MKVSRTWLQKFFDTPLPEAAELAEALTFHAFEIEGIEENDILDVKVTPNRGHDCLSHRGIAKELSAILSIPLAHDPFSETKSLSLKTKEVTVSVENETLCPRYIAAIIRGVRVGPSPRWLSLRLEALGQRSINNVVDATNFVMFNLGQPLHAFDAAKLKKRDDTWSIAVRNAREGERIHTLDGKDYTLTSSILVISDPNADEAIGIAGVKGGMPAAITEETVDIIIESANFNGPCVRKGAQTLKLRTDASSRFEQDLSPELAGYAMNSVVELIRTLAGGEILGVVDKYPNPQKKQEVAVSLSKINAILGTTFDDDKIANIFSRLGFSFKHDGKEFLVTAPLERLDILLPEDLAEEVGRIAGYDEIPLTPLPPLGGEPEINQSFSAVERAREDFISKGYSEVITSVFADAGERTVANKIDGVRPYLRSTLTDNLQSTLKRNLPNKELLGLKEIKLFEVGPVWRNGKEVLMVGSASEKGRVNEVPLSLEAHVPHYDTPSLSQLRRYRPFSRFPYIVRDVALWVPNGTNAEEVLHRIQEHAGSLVVNSYLFDTFKKGEKESLAFRLIFQSFERTLEDSEANQVMEKIHTFLRAQGFEIR